MLTCICFCLSRFAGTLLSTYKVEDKKQVAEFDPQAWLDESRDEDEETARPCPICNLCDQEEVLLLCDGCDAPYHTHCIGLDSVPDGSWFCMECADVFGLEEQAVPRPSTIVRSGPAGGGARRRGDFFPRTRASMRRSRNRIRSDEWQGAWGQIAGRIWDVLSLDLDNDEEGDEALEEYRRSQQLRERELREYQRWQQRVNIASRLGARDVFTRNIPTVFANGSQQRQQPRQANNPGPDAAPPPPQETREERRAWGALERAIECDTTSSPGNRKRKSRSSTASPREPPAEPERRLKRPRTRRLVTQGEASSSKPPASASTSHRSERPGSTSAALPAAQADGGAAPSFLSSLLKEVQMSTPSDDENVRGLSGPPGHPTEASSPGSSPAGSPYASPRALSLTPPPPKSSTRRPTSPTLSLSSHIEPIYPPANYSPTRTNGEHSDSEGRSQPQQNGAAGKSPELRQPRPRRARQEVRLPRSQDVSPTRIALPFEMKESISSIVRSALKPHWKSSKLSAEQYEAINRDVSRKLYEGVTDPAAAAVDGEARRTWEKIATREVARAIEELKA